MSLEHFHYKMSAYQARLAGLRDRGTIEPGKAADIIIYDLEALRHDLYKYERANDLPADEWRLVDRAEGYRFVIVNGEIIFRDGIETGAHPGELLRVTSDNGQEQLLAAAE